MRRIETVLACSYEDESGLYGYANHRDFRKNPGAIPVRIIRERDYRLLLRVARAAEGIAHYYGGGDTDDFGFEICEAFDALNKPRKP